MRVSDARAIASVIEYCAATFFSMQLSKEFNTAKLQAPPKVIERTKTDDYSYHRE